MSAWTLYALSGLLLTLIGLNGLFTRPNLIQKIIAANLMGNGVFLVLVALARRTGHAQPDPVPHALVLTGIVVSVSATSLALTLARRLDAPSEHTPPASPAEEGRR